ncbi:SDR family NAD(P)-dependent oxidoreductase [Shewanella psychrotolerans]|uniref:SDR family NAD(P)-dependent oxidoreductase n=1 Tax=Shewanella psychrotolerans TaxID=2864206 RepID=UPI001C65C7DD|nr:SDR family oxidoreductase [Shewanella psychrotolerans]QYK03040.1 SDR family oxidoreductase [Shewanella psychrotolerans]
MKLSNQYPTLSGKTVFITGGATGIGACLVEAFLQQGAKVAFVDILDNESNQLVDYINKQYIDPELKFYHCDLVDIPALQAVIAQVEVDLGPIGVLINNAACDERHKIEQLTPEYWDRCINTNLKHYFFAAQAVRVQMCKLGGGSIINLGSMSWHNCQGGMAGYTAAKAGVMGLTRGLVADLGKDHIRINTLTPGWVMTKRQLTHWVDRNTAKYIEDNQCIKDYVMPEDIAAMALFLASDDSKLCTAQNFIVDGGWI